ncbi:unnamed protein product [Symbiodinium necroappetens]|uniref:Pentatricopeptide repeat-containing protein, chloroplastic n=1 Tax=Symbiodinium necroappetens TaxID=1628268 RepID=A0A812SG21_9DINO|nr:unnamed protein product [Symbiodinium necroappetens]
MKVMARLGVKRRAFEPYGTACVQKCKDYVAGRLAGTADAQSGPVPIPAAVLLQVVGVGAVMAMVLLQMGYMAWVQYNALRMLAVAMLRPIEPLFKLAGSPLPADVLDFAMPRIIATFYLAWVCCGVYLIWLMRSVLHGYRRMFREFSLGRRYHGQDLVRAVGPSVFHAQWATYTCGALIGNAAMALVLFMFVLWLLFLVLSLPQFWEAQWALRNWWILYGLLYVTRWSIFRWVIPQRVVTPDGSVLRRRVWDLVFPTLTLLNFVLGATSGVIRSLVIAPYLLIHFFRIDITYLPSDLCDPWPQSQPWVAWCRQGRVSSTVSGIQSASEPALLELQRLERGARIEARLALGEPRAGLNAVKGYLFDGLDDWAILEAAGLADAFIVFPEPPAAPAQLNATVEDSKVCLRLSIGFCIGCSALLDLEGKQQEEQEMGYMATAVQGGHPLREGSWGKSMSWQRALVGSARFANPRAVPANSGAHNVASLDWDVSFHADIASPARRAFAHGSAGNWLCLFVGSERAVAGPTVLRAACNGQTCKRLGSLPRPCPQRCTGQVFLVSGKGAFDKEASASFKKLASQRWTVAMSLLGSDWEGLWLPFSPLMIAMQACTRQSHWQRSLALFGSVSSSLSPVLYSAALSACDKGQQWRSGLQVLTTLRLERGEVDTALYNGAISMCAKAQQWQHSLALFQDLQEDRLQPDLITHNSLVSAFEKGGQWQRALAAFEETSSIGPSIVTYSGCISACARGGQWQFALFLFKEAKEQSVGVDVILCSAAITACRGDQWPRALQLLTDFEDTSRANLVAYSAAVSACAPGGHWQQALQLLVLAQTRAIRADTAIYTSLIAACAGASSWQQAVFVLRQLRSGMLKANQITYNAVLSACENAEEWQHALEVLASLRQESIQADVASFSSAVGVCGRCWHWQQSLHLLSAALQNSVQANVILYSTAISACEKGNQWGVALHLLDQAQRVALRIDVVASSAAISACEKAGQWQRSTFLLEGLGPNEALVIKACTSDSRNFESACATLVEHYSGVHLRAGGTLLGGPNEDHRRSGKGPRQGSIGKGYSRGKGKVFVRKAYIAEDEALAFPEEEGFGDDDNQDIYQETSYPALGDEHGYELERVCGHVSQEQREHVYTMDPAVMRGTFADEVPQEFNKERKAAAKRILEATEQAITTVMDQSPGLIKGLKNCTFAVPPRPPSYNGSPRNHPGGSLPWLVDLGRELLLRTGSRRPQQRMAAWAVPPVTASPRGSSGSNAVPPPPLLEADQLWKEPSRSAVRPGGSGGGPPAWWATQWRRFFQHASRLDWTGRAIH